MSSLPCQHSSRYTGYAMGKQPYQAIVKQLSLRHGNIYKSEVRGGGGGGHHLRTLSTRAWSGGSSELCKCEMGGSWLSQASTNLRKLAQKSLMQVNVSGLLPMCTWACVDQRKTCASRCHDSELGTVNRAGTSDPQATSSSSLPAKADEHHSKQATAIADTGLTVLLTLL